MQVYLVGGAVRDQLLGLPVKERDWVVVGATAEDMLRLGYRQVGHEFPVFLHPRTREEYALARKEQKVSPGYTGFTVDTSPEVTLHDDLLRRDLTINAMAQTVDGQLIDPCHGKRDLDERMLRHVSFAFTEDPVRVLRVGRFLARYAYLGFRVSLDTIELMRHMVSAGEIDALVAERVWKELERALGEKNPEKFFTLLEECHALPKLFPGISVTGIGMQALIAASQLSYDIKIRFAALLHAIPDAYESIQTLCQRYRLPNSYRQLAHLTAMYYQHVVLSEDLSVDVVFNLFSVFDVFRREQRFHDFMLSCHAIARARHIAFDSDWWLSGVKAVKMINVQHYIQQGYTGNKLALKLQQERQEKIAEWLLTKVNN